MEGIEHHAAGGVPDFADEACGIGLCVEEVAFEAVEGFDAEADADFTGMFGGEAHAFEAPFPFVGGGSGAGEESEGGVERSDEGFDTAFGAAIEGASIEFDPFGADGGIGADGVIFDIANGDGCPLEAEVIEAFSPGGVVEFEIEHGDFDAIEADGLDLLEDGEETVMEFAGPQEQVHAVFHGRIFLKLEGGLGGGWGGLGIDHGESWILRFAGIPPCLGLKVPSVHSVVVEGDPFGETVSPRTFGDFLSGDVLGAVRGHFGEFLHDRLALGGIAGAMFGGEGFEDIGSFEDDAAAGLSGDGLAEVAEELALIEDLFEGSSIVDRLGGELDDGARLDIAGRSDVVREAGHGGAEGLALSVVVGIDDDDWFVDARVDDELAHAAEFFGGEGEFGRAFGSNHAVDVEPAVHDSHGDEFVDPGIAEEVIDIGFADAGADAGHDFVVEAILETFHGLAEDAGFAASLVADDFGAFDADQRGDVAEFVKFLGDLGGDEVTVGEDLEVGIGVGGEDIEQFFVEEGFTAEDAEEGVAHGFGFADESIHGIEIDFRLFAGDVDPAALAAEVAGIDDRDVEERGEEFAAFEASFMFLDGAPAAEAGLVGEIPEEAFIGFEEEAFGEAKVHHEAMGPYGCGISR